MVLFTGLIMTIPHTLMVGGVPVQSCNTLAKNPISAKVTTYVLMKGIHNYKI